MSSIEMKRNILSEIHHAYSQAKGDIAANGGSDAGEKRLRKIGQTIEGYGYGDGFELDDIKDVTLQRFQFENYFAF